MIVTGLQVIWSFKGANSGLINDEEAPESIKNLKERPNGDDISMNGSFVPCLFMSIYPVGFSRLMLENFEYRQCWEWLEAPDLDDCWFD